MQAILTKPERHAAPEALSEAGRRRLIDGEGEPLLVADWLRAVFIHYAVEPEILQTEVPFTLDVREGTAYVSLVAFIMRGMRFFKGGGATAWMTAPIATHPFLNVRTYVRHEGEAGIYFLTEWLPNRLSVLLGGPLFGLPYRYGALRYDHRHETGRLAGCVRVPGTPGTVRYHAPLDRDAHYRLCEPGSLEAFLMERYTAFTARGRRRQRFRVWHPPWPYTPLDLTLDDDTLLDVSGAWYRHAALAGAAYTPGVRRVWMGHAQRLAPAGRNDAVEHDPG